MFTITPEQIVKIQEWDKCKGKYHGAIGGHLTYCFTPTGLGIIVQVQCGRCKEKLDISEYDHW